MALLRHLHLTCRWSQRLPRHILTGSIRARNNAIQVGAPRFALVFATTAAILAVGVVDGLIYAVGGVTTPLSTLASVERYDPATDQWQSLAPLPIAVNHPGAAVAGGKLFVFGGITQSPFDIIGNVFAFDSATGEWTGRAPMPEARAATATATIDGIIYVAGGLPGNRNRQFAAYDPGTDQWSTLADMPTGRDHLAAAALDGRFYAFSGRDGGVLKAATEVFDPATGEWSTAAPIPTPRGGIAAGAVGGRAYVFGGEGNPEPGTDGVFSEVEEYDPATDEWRALADMPKPRHGIWAGVHDGRIYLPGGGAVEGLGDTPAHDIFTPPAFDSDGDGLADDADNCSALANPDQRDTDNDGYGNACDPDLNGDCIANFLDLGNFKAQFLMEGDLNADFNGDGVVNFIDLGTMRSRIFEPPGPSGLTTVCDSARSQPSAKIAR